MSVILKDPPASTVPIFRGIGNVYTKMGALYWEETSLKLLDSLPEGHAGGNAI
jgi:hypothetical protein